MTRKRILLLLVVLLALGSIWVWRSTQPRLTVLIYGKPPQGASIIGGFNSTPLSIDQDGNIKLPAGAKTPNLIMMKTADGKNWTIRYPQRGHRTVDLRGRYSKSVTVFFDLGFYRHRKQSEQIELTDEEMDQVEHGELSFEEIERRIRELEDHEAPSN